MNRPFQLRRMLSAVVLASALTGAVATPSLAASSTDSPSTTSAWQVSPSQDASIAQFGENTSDGRLSPNLNSPSSSSSTSASYPIYKYPPSKAFGRCNGWETFQSGAWTSQLPVYYATNGISLNCWLAQGYGPPAAVTPIQWMLKTCNGHPNLAQDGIFGPATDQAIRNTQRGVMDVDGKYGEQMRKYAPFYWDTGSGSTCATLPKSWL